MQQYVALLRAISNVSMKSFREAMEALGFTGVESYGMSGNLLFNAPRADMAVLEEQITAQFSTRAMVRTRTELARIVAKDPFDNSILLLRRAPAASRKRALLELDFESPHPVLRGKTVYFVHPAQLRGKRASFDFERALGVLGTARSARVVRQILARMSDSTND